MSFWSNFFQFQNFGSPVIDTLLDQPNEFTLDKLLEEDDLLQEAKSQNEKLLNFLTQSENLQKLIIYITEEPTTDGEKPPDLKRQFKYPFVACELLCLELPALFEKILDAGSSEDSSNSNSANIYLDQLFNFFSRNPPLNPTLSGYISKVASSLLKYNTNKTIHFMKGKKELIGNILRHLGNASVMDFLVRIIGTSDVNNNANNLNVNASPVDPTVVLEWLNESELISTLIEKFDPINEITVHENVSQVLVDIIIVLNTLAQNQPNINIPLLNKLESNEILGKLFGYILQDAGLPRRLSSSTEHGIKVLIALLERHILAQYDTATQAQDLPNLLKVIANHMDPIHKRLNNPKGSGKVKLTDPIGEIEGVGFERLKIVEFLAVLSQTNYHSVNTLLLSMGIFQSIVKLFFAHPWNNFLHATVEWLIQGILSRENEELKLHLLKDCQLVDFIIEAIKLNEEDVKKPKGARRGYLGHVTSISIGILSAASTASANGNNLVEKFLEEHKGWAEYITQVLQPTLDREGREFSFGNSRSTEQMGGEEAEEQTEAMNLDESDKSIDQQFEDLQKEISEENVERSDSTDVQLLDAEANSEGNINSTVNGHVGDATPVPSDLTEVNLNSPPSSEGTPVSEPPPEIKESTPATTAETMEVSS